MQHLVQKESCFVFLMIRRPPRSTRKESSAASDVYKRQAHKTSNPQVKVLNQSRLPQLDGRLAFLSYIVHETEGSVNVEASASIRAGSCWSVLRFSALKKQSKDEALNHFANLIRATQLVK